MDLDFKLEVDAGLMEKSKEELVIMIKALQAQNEELGIKLSAFQQDQFCSPTNSLKISESHLPLTHEKALLDLGSIGSSSIYFLQAADNSVLGGEGDVTSVSTSSAQVRENYLQLERGANAFKAPDVMFYKTLFSKDHCILDYDADSPLFRARLEEMDSSVDVLRNYLHRLVDDCRSYCDKGNAYSESGRKFCSLLLKLQDDDWVLRIGDVATLLSNFGFVLDEVQAYREGVLSSLETTFAAPMEEFVKIEVKTIKKLRADLQRSGEEYEQALAKYLAMKTGTDPELKKSREKELAALRKQFELHRFDIVAELNACASKKKFQLCERVCSALYAYLGYFHQCHTLLATIEPAVRQLTSELNSARKEFSREQLLIAVRRRQLKADLDRSIQGAYSRKRINRSQSKISRYWRKKRELRCSIAVPSIRLDDSLQVELDALTSTEHRVEVLCKSGYLWKRSTSLNRSWQRRWFYIKEGKMYYMHSDDKDSQGQLVCDLLISTVKLDPEAGLMYTFEIISPGQRKYILQAESDEERDEWVTALRNEIEFSLMSNGVRASNSGLTFTTESDRIRSIRAKNHECADCGAENPEWISLNLNILICIECSGIHRSLGTHISKVRSLTLDTLPEHTVELLDRLGNGAAKQIWEAIPYQGEDISTLERTGEGQELSSPQPATPSRHYASTSSDRNKARIVAKYVHRKYVTPMSVEGCNTLLFTSAANDDLLGIMKAIAAGADINFRHPQYEMKTALHISCINQHFLVVELLCLFNASVEEKDAEDKTPLDYADNEENSTIIDILIQKLERDLQC